MNTYYAHPTACIDMPCTIGLGTKIWHFSHVMENSFIGDNCILGQNVFIASNVKIGNYVKIQNNVSIYSGVELNDYVFCGPSCVFTNVITPRSEIPRHENYQKTLVKRGATIGANATIVCGTTIGKYAFIAAGSVVLRSTVPDYALMMGIPAKQKGWISRHGSRLIVNNNGTLTCPESNWKYQEISPGVLRCLDCDEDSPIA